MALGWPCGQMSKVKDDTMDTVGHFSLSLAHQWPLPFLTSSTLLWAVVSSYFSIHEAFVYPSFFTSSQLLKLVPIAEKLSYFYAHRLFFFLGLWRLKVHSFFNGLWWTCIFVQNKICTNLFQNQLSPWTIYIPSLIQLTSYISCQAAFIESIICILNLPSKSNWWLFTEEFEN